MDIRIMAAVEGLLFGVSMFCFMLDRNGGAEGLKSKYVYEREASSYEKAADECDQEMINCEVLNLYSQYEDFVGFLTVDGTSIAYPVMRDRTDSSGNYYYLTHDYRGEDDRSGCPFIRRSADIDGDIVEIYAHNNSNGTMFADLVKFENEEFFNRYGRVTLDTADGKREYRVIAVLDVEVGGGEFNYFGWSNFASDEDEAFFLDEVYGSAVISSDAFVPGGGSYLMLVTCEYSHQNGRRVVVAVSM